MADGIRDTACAEEARQTQHAPAIVLPSLQQLETILARAHADSTERAAAARPAREHEKNKRLFPFMDLPDPVREQILEYLVYDTRLVLDFQGPHGASTRIKLPFIAFMDSRKLYREVVRAILMNTTLKITYSKTDRDGLYHWLASLNLSSISRNQTDGFDAIQKLSFPKFGDILEYCSFNHRKDLAFIMKCKNLRELTLGFGWEDVLDWFSDLPSDVFELGMSADQLGARYELDVLLGLENLEVLAFEECCSDNKKFGIRDLGRWFDSSFAKQQEDGSRKKRVKVLHLM